MNFPKQPRVGDMVLFRPNPDDSIAKSNHNEESIAAIVTRVWGPICVNLKIIPDCGPMQDRTSSVHVSQNPAGYHWFYGDERDSITPDETINLMKHATYQMIDPNGINFEDDCKLIEGFFEGLRTKSKIVKMSGGLPTEYPVGSKWVKVSERLPESGKKVLTKDSGGETHDYKYHESTKSWQSVGSKPGFDNNNTIEEWLEE